MTWYIRTLAAASVCFSVSGNFLLSRGMRVVGPLVSPSPLDYLRVMAHPAILAGIALMICWLVAQLSLLSWADLSYVLPITAFGYVLTAMVGAFALGERVSLSRWAGVLLITSGVTVVSRTRARTGHVRKAGAAQ